MSYIAEITGMSGRVFYLRRSEVVERECEAQHFRSERAAEEAARRYFEQFALVVQRGMQRRIIAVEPSNVAAPRQ